MNNKMLGWKNTNPTYEFVILFKRKNLLVWEKIFFP